MNKYLIISGVNCRNDENIKDLAGIAGYALSVRIIDDCTHYIDISEYTASDTPEHERAAIRDMIGYFVLWGFTVQIKEEL